MKTAVIGLGWVGKSMKELFPNSVVYDEPLRKGSKDEINEADIAFVCVPSPNPHNDELDMSIVEEVVKWCECPLIIIRSAVNPGTCDKLEKLGKNIVYMPEYLGETVAHPLLDDKATKFLIIGGRPANRRKAIELFQEVYNANITIRQVTNLESEIIKLSENRAIMFKVLQCQELYDACQAHGIDYYTIRDAVYGDDPRFNLWWTFVFPDKRGAQSKCIPKDPYAWAAWAETSPLTDALLAYNERLLSENS
jgi:UDPglucose 6-dehydrogenase